MLTATDTVVLLQSTRTSKELTSRLYYEDSRQDRIYTSTYILTEIHTVLNHADADFSESKILSIS